MNIHECLEPVDPEAAKLHEIFIHFHDVVLGPYQQPGHKLVQDGYVALGLPWDEPLTAPLFERGTFLRKEWGGSLRTADENSSSLRALGSPLQASQSTLAPMGPVPRWREAHLDLVGTDRDCVNVAMAQIRDAFGEIKDMDDIIRLSSIGTVLLFVKRAW